MLALVTAVLLAASPWVAPVDGPPTSAFRLDPGRPYAAGQHRTLTFSARPGARVRAACAGRVSFAGALPSGGAGVTVRCADGRGLLAGHTRLQSAAVARGARVRAGEEVGRASAAVALSARRAASGAYLDPARLLAVATPGPGDRVAPPPLARVRITTYRGRPHGFRVRAHGGSPVHVPLVAWIGLGLLAGGIGLGAVWHARSARRAAGAGARTGRATT